MKSTSTIIAALIAAALTSQASGTKLVADSFTSIDAEAEADKGRGARAYLSCKKAWANYCIDEASWKQCIKEKC